MLQGESVYPWTPFLADVRRRTAEKVHVNHKATLVMMVMGSPERQVVFSPSHFFSSSNRS